LRIKCASAVSVQALSTILFRVLSLIIIYAPRSFELLEAACVPFGPDEEDPLVQARSPRNKAYRLVTCMCVSWRQRGRLWEILYRIPRCW
jgi:hypothetical protein